MLTGLEFSIFIFSITALESALNAPLARRVQVRLLSSDTIRLSQLPTHHPPVQLLPSQGAVLD